MWMLPVHGFARRRKAYIGRNETPLILVYAGGAVKTFRLHRPAYFVSGRSLLRRRSYQRTVPVAAELPGRRLS